MAALTKGGREMRLVIIPTKVNYIWISNDLSSYPAQLNLHATAGYLGFRQAKAAVIASNFDTGAPLAIIKGFQSTAVSGKNGSNEPTRRQPCFNID